MAWPVVADGGLYLCIAPLLQPWWFAVAAVTVVVTVVVACCWLVQQEEKYWWYVCVSSTGSWSSRESFDMLSRLTAWMADGTINFSVVVMVVMTLLPEGWLESLVLFSIGGP